MTKTTPDAVEPWVAVDDDPPAAGFYDSPEPFLSSGQFIRWQREEAALRAEEERKQAEAVERADARQAAALFQAKQYTLEKGLRWDPTQPFKHTPTVLQRADRLFAIQDRDARAADLKAAEAAGLLHLLHQGVPSTPEPTGMLEPPEAPGSATRNGVPLVGDPRDDTSPAGKARRALRRWSSDRRRHQRLSTRTTTQPTR